MKIKYGVTFGLLLFLTQSLFAQSAAKDLLIRKWNYIGVEEFGVVHTPDSLMMHDWIQFYADGHYSALQKGNAASGTWKMNESAKTISLTHAKTKKTLTYNLKNLTPADLTLEYQTPDLVRTKYRYKAAGQ